MSLKDAIALRRPILVLLFGGLVACGAGEPEQVVEDPAAALSVFVVNYPLQYFAERIGGAEVEVSFPVPRDQDPALWSPGPEIITAYQGADLILLNGAGYAAWVDKVSLPPSKLVDTSKGFSDEYVESRGELIHSHGPQGEHSHTGAAFTTWLDPLLAIEQARAVKDALVGAVPEEAPLFEQRFEELRLELSDLDQRLRRAISGNPNVELIASHPVYQYLAQRYGLRLRSVVWEPGVVPDETMWEELEAMLEERPAYWMVWEGEPVADSVSRLEMMGLGSIVYDPAAHPPHRGDFMSVMQQNVTSLEAAFAEQVAEPAES